ncbi:MAG: sensor histidine kinase [Clostridia bacterium]|nr:sensor histidine kinase [Clostridia bacterium]
MKELSLNILDVAKNSTAAGATKVEISLELAESGILTISIIDNGCGMSEETLMGVTNPFYTTRKTRKVGMGLPLLKMAAEQTGGELRISSSTEKGNSGTSLSATFDTKSIDCMPLGDIISTVCILIAGSPEVDFLFTDKRQSGCVQLDTAQLREVLGSEISLAEPEIQMWIREYLEEQYQSI